MIDTAREALGDLEEFLSAVSTRRFERRRTRTLSAGERDVLALLADGYTTVQVATRLSISPHTVRSRVKAARAKLGARTREQAVATAIRAGVL